MTKTEYEKELERDIEKWIEKCKPNEPDVHFNKPIWDKLNEKLKAYKKGKEEGIKEGMERGLHLQRVRMIELGDKKFISDLYTDDTIDTDSYDIIVNVWEGIKRELNQVENKNEH